MLAMVITPPELKTPLVILLTRFVICDETETIMTLWQVTSKSKKCRTYNKNISSNLIAGRFIGVVV